MILGAFIGLCQTIETSLGPVLSEIVGIVGVAAFTWWRARKLITHEVGKATAKADAGIAHANEQASKAKAEARAVNVQLAEIRGSLRPSSAALATPLPPVIGTSSSQSGNFEPITMPELGVGTPRPRPSMPDPSLDEASPPSFPRPARIPAGVFPTSPADEGETRPDTPNARRK
ncbi:MAG TPA: hypothetical protein VK524_02290 [Polyangiaceae bacterium]|nr:hypothetical protein [Polyangiaceae bacterium]